MSHPACIQKYDLIFTICGFSNVFEDLLNISSNLFNQSMREKAVRVYDALKNL